MKKWPRPVCELRSGRLQVDQATVRFIKAAVAWHTLRGPSRTPGQDCRGDQSKTYWKVWVVPVGLARGAPHHLSWGETNPYRPCWSPSARWRAGMEEGPRCWMRTDSDRAGHRSRSPAHHAPSPGIPPAARRSRGDAPLPRGLTAPRGRRRGAATSGVGREVGETLQSWNTGGTERGVASRRQTFLQGVKKTGLVIVRYIWHHYRRNERVLWEITLGLQNGVWETVFVRFGLRKHNDGQTWVGSDQAIWLDEMRAWVLHTRSYSLPQ